MPIFASALLGLLIGSFLNVVIARLPHGKSLVAPRSHCPGCQNFIVWYDNIPLLSWLILKGKCRHCKTAISVRYPVIELLTALLFVAAEMRMGFSLPFLVRDLPFIAILVAVTFIDLEHRIIPDELSLGGLAWGLVTTLGFWLLLPRHASDAEMISIVSSFGGAALGFGLFFGLSWAYLRWSGRSGLGGGDVKLLAMLGAYLGPRGIFITILVSSVSGSVIGIGWALWARKKGIPIEPIADLPPDLLEETPQKASIMTASIPYGPFLVIGALYYYLWGFNLE